MIKTFCDLCGKEVESYSIHKQGYRIAITRPETDKMDLCSKCYSSICEHLETLRIKTWEDYQ